MNQESKIDDLTVKVGRWKLPLVTPPRPSLHFSISSPLNSYIIFPLSKTVRMSGHCHDDHDHSGHGHDHAGHDHSDDITPALQHSLYQHINFDDITTRNESEVDSGKAIVKKTWAERLEEQPELESDADEQLLIHIPCVCDLPRRRATS